MTRSQPLRFRWEQAVRKSPDVRGTCLAVVLTAATYGNLDGSKIRVSQAAIAADTGLVVRTVRRHLAAAVEAGWLTEVRRGHRMGNGTATATEYRLILPSDTSAQPASTVRLKDVSTGPPRPVENPPTGHSEPLNRTREVAQPGTSDRLPERPGGPVMRAFPKQCDQHQDAVHEDDCRGCMRARQAHEHREAERRSHSETEPRCEEHDWERARTCQPCHSEVKTGMRSTEYIGRRIPTEDQLERITT